MRREAEIISLASERKEFSTDKVVATVGFFDGVHAGHRYLIKELKELAALKGAPAMVITFSEHPRKVLQHTYIPKLLNTPEEKKELLSCTEIDYLTLLAFTREFSLLTAEEFIGMLAKEFRVGWLLVGYDHRFGRNRTEGYREYVRYAAKYGIEMVQSDVFRCDNTEISATLIRKLLEQGELREANRYLTYPYFIRGEVVSGRQIGRTIGFPTANIYPDSREKVIPRVGAYAIYACINGKRYGGMLNVGYRPTVGLNDKLSLEAHLFDFKEKIYGEKIQVEFIGYVRDEKKFEDITQLQRQLEEDKQKVKEILQICSYDF
ncbi:MAG: bifunctional riboflavin kinase/FAD synthetase [Candidatus Azobacteroides sp.]|nr:bifunctional riboflavin kinase/FAD synthetase [Candidatus Azobacteroides sp.]